MVLKKKEIIAASLVVLIGLAGYLNWSYQDTVRVRDNDSYVQTGKMLGEAEMVSASNETKADGDEADTAAPETEEAAAAGEASYFSEAKMNRETARAAAMEALKEASEDESLDEETRATAGQRLIECAENIELESNVENIAAAKGYEDVCVYINDGSATVTVKTEGLTDQDAATLTDIVTCNTSIPTSGVKIVEVK